MARYNDRFSGEARTFLPGLPYHDVWCRVADPAVPGGHADSFITSISLHLRPETVRVDRIPDPGHQTVDWNDPDVDFSRYSSTGVIGDPTHASAELGARLWRAVVEETAAILKEIAEGGADERLDSKDRLHFLWRGGHRDGHGRG